MADTVHVSVADASQVGEARRVTARVAQEAGLDQTRAGEAAIIATELANNLIRYGGGGLVLLQPMQTALGRAVQILAVDAGPGMADVDACLRDGYSTGGTPGNGLGAVRRLSSEFDIFSLPGRGTVVLSRVGTEPPVPLRAPGPAAWGALGKFAPRETVCGDTWRVVERPEGLAILIADGLGHGPGAAEAAGAVAEAFEADPFASPAQTVALAHRLTSKTRGAAVAVARVDFDTRTMRYCGVGNIAGSLFNHRDSRGLFTHNGTVGHQNPKIVEFDYLWPAGGLLVMHSDGLQTRWDLDDYPGLAHRHPAVIAAILMRDFVRGKDDVTVLAVRLRA